MNAYEIRAANRKAKRQARTLEVKNLKLHELGLLQRYYISAYTALNGQPPKIVSTDTGVLFSTANTMFARIHEIQLGGNDEQELD